VPDDHDVDEVSADRPASAGTPSDSGDAARASADRDTAAEERLRGLESSFAAVEEAMESLLRITADGGDGPVVVAQIEAVVSPERFPLDDDEATGSSPP